MDLAKACVDIGVFTNRREAMLAFWQQDVGLAFDELLPVGGGVHQHRHRIGDSIFKLNHAREPLETALAPAGYRHLYIRSDGVAAPTPLTDPDGNAVTLLPDPDEPLVRVHLEVSDARAFDAFYGRALELPSAGQHAYRVGTSVLSFEESREVSRDPEMRGVGYRYLTIQVKDVVAEHRGILARGGREGRPPAKLGEVARISFVRDPDGNWIEISQRRSLTGSLD
jgi:catechol 2,3-dioxygenase-like lactoylglutathione lyase family enzyme